MIKAIHGAMIFLLHRIFSLRDVNDKTSRDFIIIVAIVHIGAVKRSASPPPIAAAAIAYGVGNRQAAIYMSASPK